MPILGDQDRAAEVPVAHVGLHLAIEPARGWLRHKKRNTNEKEAGASEPVACKTPLTTGDRRLTTKHTRATCQECRTIQSRTPKYASRAVRHSASSPSIRSSRTLPIVRMSLRSESVMRPSCVGSVQMRCRVKCDWGEVC